MRIMEVDRVFGVKADQSAIFTKSQSQRDRLIVWCMTMEASCMRFMMEVKSCSSIH